MPKPVYAALYHPLKKYIDPVVWQGEMLEAIEQRGEALTLFTQQEHDRACDVLNVYRELQLHDLAAVRK